MIPVKLFLALYEHNNLSAKQFCAKYGFELPGVLGVYGVLEELGFGFPHTIDGETHFLFSARGENAYDTMKSQEIG